MVPGIDVKRCVARKNYEDDLEFDFEGNGDDLDDPYLSFSSLIHAKLHYVIFDDDSVDVTGTLSFLLKGACARCLAETEEKVCFPVEATFVPREPKDVEYGYRDVISLSEFLHDSVLFAIPSKILCSSCADEQ